jgi:hypothetical protein
MHAYHGGGAAMKRRVGNNVAKARAAATVKRLRERIKSLLTELERAHALLTRYGPRRRPRNR